MTTAQEIFNDVLNRNPELQKLPAPAKVVMDGCWFTLYFHDQDSYDHWTTDNLVAVCHAIECDHPVKRELDTSLSPPATDNVSGEKHTLPIDSAERKAYPICEGVLRYFPAAIAAAAKVSKHGNDKHNPGEPMHHARGKSMDHADCIVRHLIDLPEDFGNGVGYDEHGLPQVGYLVWRALALAQEWLEKHEGAPLAPNAKL